MGTIAIMKPSYGTSVGLGAVAGLVLAECALLFVGATGGVPKLDVIGSGSDIEPVFSVPASALWMVLIVASLACGILLAVTTWAIARTIEPDAHGANCAIIGATGAVVAVAVSFAVFPLGVTVLGSLTDGVATLSVADMAAMCAIVGVAGGAAIVWLSYILTRPPQPAEDPELLAT
jgi:hypothetical protein